MGKNDHHRLKKAAKEFFRDDQEQLYRDQREIDKLSVQADQLRKELKATTNKDKQEKYRKQIDLITNKISALTKKHRRSRDDFNNFLENGGIKDSAQNIDNAYEWAFSKSLPTYTKPKRKSKQDKFMEEFFDKFNKIFITEGSYFISKKCWEIEAVNTEDEDKREWLMSRVTELIYKRILDKLGGGLIYDDNFDGIPRDISIEFVIEKIEEILLHINLTEFIQTEKKALARKVNQSEGKMIPKKEPEVNREILDIQNEVRKILGEVAELPEKSRSRKIKLKELNEIWTGRYDGSYIVLGLDRKGFYSKYFWDGGVKNIKRYKDFDSFYRKICLEKSN